MRRGRCRHGGNRAASRAIRVSAVLASVAAACALTACHGPALASHPPKPKPLVKHVPLTSPFTGERIARLGPELIFKIDNVEQARPPTGLTKADLIYILPVEGGLSRIMAVFSSHIPRIVGPVRSSREEDIALLRQFGRPAFAFSGAQPRLLPKVERARIVNLYAGIVGGYFRDWNRYAPYNLYAETRILLREAPHASKARDIGFVFGAAPPGGTPTRSFSISYRAASFRFVWVPRQHRWHVWMDGRPAWATEGGILGGRTIVVQYVRVAKSGFLELGQAPPYANTVGSGTALVLRDGRAYRVHWARAKPDHGTHFTLPDGKPMPFAVGQVWIIYGFAKNSTL